MKTLFFSGLFLVSTCVAWSQPGGQRAFDFLNLPISSKSAALGGFHITASEAELQTSQDNPALIDSTLEGYFGLNYINYMADIQYGIVNYGFDTKKRGTFVAGLQYLNYGNFLETDVFGNVLSEFSASEYAASLSYGYKLSEQFSVGASAKFAVSDFNNASGLQESAGLALGIATDLGGRFISKDKQTVVGITARNLGVQVLGMYEGERNPLPFTLQAGISRKIAKAPFRLSLLLNNLQTWKLAYDEENEDAEIDPITGEAVEEFSLDNLLRKGVIGVEFVPSQNFNLRLGYNHNRRRDLALANAGGATGFSFGAAFIIKRFQFNYTLASYHRAGASHFIGLNFIP